MRTASLSLVLLAAPLLVGCDPAGACVRPGREGSNVDRGSCVVNNKKSMCRGEFVEGGGAEGLALCRARGFTTAKEDLRQLTPAEIDEKAADGTTVTLFPPLAAP